MPDERDADGHGPEPAADHRRHPARDRLLAEARGVEVDVHVDRTGRRDHALGRAHVGVGADRHARCHAVHDLRVPGLADADDAAVLDPDVGLHDAQHGVDQHDVRDHEVERALRRRDRAVRAETVPQRLAAAEYALVARHQQVLLDLGPQIRVAEPDAVSRRRPEQLGVRAPRHLASHHAPLVKPGSAARSSAPSAQHRRPAPRSGG